MTEYETPDEAIDVFIRPEEEWAVWRSISSAMDIIRLGEILRGIGIVFVCCCFMLIPIGQLLKIIGLSACLRVPQRAKALPWVMASLSMEIAVLGICILLFTGLDQKQKLIPVLIGGIVAGQILFFLFLRQSMYALHEPIMVRLITSFATLWFLHIMALISKFQQIANVNPKMGFAMPNAVQDVLEAVSFIVPVLVHLSYHAMLEQVKNTFEERPTQIHFNRWILLIFGVGLEWVIVWLQQ